jgi:hypothetical protein
MMRDSRCIPQGASAALLVLLLPALACGASAPSEPPQDPLAAEIARAAALLQSKPDNQVWAEVRQPSQTALTRAEEDLRAGRRELALQRLTNVQANLASATYLSEHSAKQHPDLASFEAEWTRLGGALRAELGTPSPTAFDGVPAAARAFGEAALPQVRGYYDASLSYGRATMPEAGLYYLSSAEAQRSVADFIHKLPAAKSPGTPPRLRSIRPELDALENEMLAVYKPPVSIDRHGEFITANSTLKEAYELDAAGLRYGALLRYLQAAEQSAALRAAAPAADAGALDQRLEEMEKRLAAGGVDHSLGRLFLETARSEKDKVTPGSASLAAATIANDVLPRYFAALEAARPEAPQPASAVTVTLVRWPYT